MPLSLSDIQSERERRQSTGSSGGISLSDIQGERTRRSTPDIINPADLIPAQELPVAVAQSTGVVPAAPVFDLGIDERNLPPSARLQPRRPSLIDRALSGVAAQGRKNAAFVGEVIQPRINEAFPTVPTDELSVKNRSFSDLVSRGLLGGVADVAGFLGGQIPALLDPKKLVPEGTDNPELQVGKDLASGIGNLLQSGLVTADQLASIPIEAATGGKLTSPIKSIVKSGKSDLTEEGRQQILQEAVDRPQDPAFGAAIALNPLSALKKARGAKTSAFAKAVEQQRAKVEPKPIQKQPIPTDKPGLTRFEDLVKQKRQKPAEPKPSGGVTPERFLSAGEVTKTSSGRNTTPFPDLRFGGKVKTANTIKRVDKWLVDNAIAEAKSRGDEFNLLQFENIKPKRITTAEKDGLNEYLFGEQPDVIRPFLKPLSPSKPTVKPKVEVAETPKEIDIADATDIAKKPETVSGGDGSVELGFLGITPQAVKGVIKTGKAVVEDLSKGSLPKALKSAKRRVELEDSKGAFRELDRVEEIEGRRTGGFNEKLRGTVIHKSVAANIKDVATKKRMTGEQIADAMEGKGTLEQRVAVKDVTKVMNEALFKIKATQNKVGIKPTGFIKDFFPRMLKQDIATKISEDLRGVINDLSQGDIADRALAKKLSGIPETETLVNHLLKTGQANSTNQAIRQLFAESRTQLFGTPSFIKKRSLELPASVYERNARVVIPWYMRKTARYTAQLDVWGKNAEKLVARLQRINNIDIEEGKIVSLMLDRWSGKYYAEQGLSTNARTFLSGVRNFEVLTKIGLGLSVIPNAMQPLISTFVELPVGQVAKGAFKAVFSAERRAQVRKTGAVEKSSIQDFISSSDPGESGFGKLTKVVTIPFNTAQRMNTYYSASSFIEAARSFHDIANGKAGIDFKGFRKRWAQDRLKDFGLDHTKPLEKNLLAEKAFRFATDDQLIGNLLNDQVALSHPAIRNLVILKRFGIRQTIKMKNAMLRELRREGINTPEKLVRTAPTLIKFFLGAQVAGETATFIKNEIREFISGEDRSRRDKPFSLERIVNNIAAAGSFGVVSDLSDIYGFGTIASRIEFALKPVIMADVLKVISTVDAIIKETNKYDSFSLALRRQGPKLAEDVGGVLVKDLRKRTLTKSQRKNRDTTIRGRARTDILEKIIAGDKEEALRLLKLYNKENPNNKMLPDDNPDSSKRKTWREVAVAKAKRDAKNKAIAEL